jgi:hypothetical protein
MLDPTPDPSPSPAPAPTPDPSPNPSSVPDAPAFDSIPDDHSRVVSINNVGNVAFPDHMSDEDVSAAAAKLHATANPAPTAPTSATPDPFSQPIYEHPDVVKAMQGIWTSNRNGNAKSESSFVVHSRRPDGTPIIRNMPDTNDYAKETFSIMPGDTAIVHTHPNGMNYVPSPADMKIADEHPGLEMYVVSQHGLYRYVKGMKKPEQIYSSTDFLAPKMAKK